jgi:tRNA-Thr(GGU) m(6)t(6)A37 methyltransferase TsaA
MIITYQPIGFIHSPFTKTTGMPIQPPGATGIEGTVTVKPEFLEGLRDLDGFSHLILLYHFHQVTESQLVVTPFLDQQRRGVFATRAPKRPNPIGLSVVRLIRVETSILHIQDVDILDGTPLLDIKPYVPEFDGRPAARAGWFERVKGQVQDKRADDRFQ